MSIFGKGLGSNLGWYASYHEFLSVVSHSFQLRCWDGTSIRLAQFPAKSFTIRYSHSAFQHDVMWDPRPLTTL
jgi:hypothetical protein